MLALLYGASSQQHPAKHQAQQPAALYLPLPARLVASAYALEEQALMNLFFQSSLPNAASANALAFEKAKPPLPLLIAVPDA